MDVDRKRRFKLELFAQFARVGRAIAAPVRLAILDVLAQAERSVEEIAGEIGSSVANTSQHLKQLRAARLVDARRNGQFMLYRLADDRVLTLWQAVRELGEARYAEIRDVVQTYLQDRDQMRTVDADELQRLIRAGAAVVLDVRPSVEFAAGHIPTARSIPVEELEDRLRELPKRKLIVAYCRGPYCVFSDDAVALLQRNGYRVARLTVGLPDWKLSGLPVEA